MILPTRESAVNKGGAAKGKPKTATVMRVLDTEFYLLTSQGKTHCRGSSPVAPRREAVREFYVLEEEDSL